MIYKKFLNKMISFYSNNEENTDALEVYSDMCAEGDISGELFKKRKEETEKKIRFLEEDNETLKAELVSAADAESKEKRLELLTDFIEMREFQEDAGIPEVIPLNIEGIKKKDTKTERTAS